MKKRPMRICFISHDFYPQIGGIASHVYHLSKSIAALGNDVIVVSIRYDRTAPFKERDEGIVVVRFLVPRIRKVRGLIFLIQAIPYVLFHSIHRRFDVVHWHNLLPDTLVSWCVRSRRKIFTNHSSTFLDLFSERRKMFFYRLLLARADTIIAPSIELAEKSALFFNRTKECVHYIPNGVDVERFSPLSNVEKMRAKDNLREKFDIQKSARIILCPRRLEPKNGIEYAIKALSKINDRMNVALLITGNVVFPEYGEYLKNLVRELDLEGKVIFVGPIPNKEMPEYYQAADVAVLPSLQEATSIAGLESLASGTPIVGTEVGGIPQIIRDGTDGFLVPAKNSELLAARLFQLLSDEALKEVFSKKARESARENFSWNIIAERTAEVYSVSH